MTWPLARLFQSICMAAVVLSASFGVSAAQEGNSGADFAASHPPPALAEPVGTVPFADGDVSHLTGLWNNPSGLEQAGQQARPGNGYGDLISNTQGATAGQVSANDDWLKSSFDLLRDPSSATGDLSTKPTTECRTETVTESHVEESVYTCESGNPVTVTSETCKRTYVPVFDTDYVYECTAGTKWSAASKVCEPERIVVVDDDYIYQCRTGTDWSSYPASCTRQRTVVVDEDYVYGCSISQPETSPTRSQGCSANGQAGCYVQAGPTCTSTNPGQSYTCQTGYSGTNINQVCQLTQDLQQTQKRMYRLMIGASTDFSLQYYTDAMMGAGCTGNWTGPWQAGMAGVRIREALVTCPFAPASPPGWTCDDYLCTSPDYGAMGASYQNNFTEYGQADAGERLLNSCGADVTADPSCHEAGTVCVDPGGTRVVNGVSYTRDCWQWEKIYACNRRVDAAGCQPPAGTTLTGQTCANAECTLKNNTYTSPATCAQQESQIRCENPIAAAGPPIDMPRDVVQDFWSNNCSALDSNGNCSKVRDTVTDNTTHVVNGLPVAGPWAAQQDYTCWTSTAVETCAPFAGCTQTKANCDNFDKNGNCSAYEKTYRCENPVNNGGTPLQTVYDVVGEYWTDPCAVQRNDPLCRLDSNVVVEGNATKVINGLSVTRDPWKRRETYTCWSGASVSTCPNPRPPSGCAQTGQRCALTDKDNNCSGYTYTFRCEVPTPGPQGAPIATPVDQVGGGFVDAACSQKSDPNCQKPPATACTQGGGTRTIDGAQATATCWEETDTYTCDRPQAETNNCSPPSGCTLREKQCLDGDNVPLAQCKAVENVFDCKKGTSTTKEQTTCTTKVCVGQECYQQPGQEKPDKELPDVIAALTIMKQAGEGQQFEPSVFKGTAMRCRKAVLGFRNCCKDSGWGVSLGLAQCDQEEKTLMTRQEAKSVYYVGTWCSSKSFIGICTEKSMRYCAFEGTLAKIVQVEGRKQINKPWGPPKTPDCSGFTVDQFQHLDLSNVDFSEFTKDMMNKVMSPDSNSTINRIKSSIDGMMGSGTAASSTAIPGGL